MTKIAPSILSADFMRLGEEIRAAEEAGADLLHIDIMDGHFVPNITIGYAVVEAIRKITKLPLDVHLMISDPDFYAPNFIKAGADFLTIHAEVSVHLHRSIQVIRENGCKPGVSLNPATSLTCIENILGDVDLILLMSVNPGFGGQKFISTTLDKIRRLKGMLKAAGVAPLIEIDGGVKPENARQIADAGADILVMGSAFFESANYRGTMEDLRVILNG